LPSRPHPSDSTILAADDRTIVDGSLLQASGTAEQIDGLFGASSFFTSTAI